MTVLELLKKARLLLSEPKRWCQGVMAQNAEGKRVASDSERACQWCLMWAVFFQLRNLSVDDRIDLSGEVFAALGRNLAELNDKGTHADVLRCYDEAIARLEAAA